MRVLPLTIVLGLALGACSSSRVSSVDLVKKADEKLRGSALPGQTAGGLEFPTVRADMRALYDEALRVAADETLDEADRRFVVSHAHFGLAMNRLWDLADRVLSILDEGGVLEALRGEAAGNSGERPAFCKLFEDFDALEAIVRLLLSTAIEPIIEDFSAVIAADPEFTMTIDRARYDLSALVVEGNADTNYLDFAAIYSAPDVRTLLGGIQVGTGLLEWAFSYRRLFANLFLFSFVKDQPAEGQAAKLFNSNPCVDYPTDGNPLLDPEFGLLVADGSVALSRAQTLIAAGLGNLAAAVASPAADQPERHLMGSEGAGRTWGAGMFTLPGGQPRFRLNVSLSAKTPMVGVDATRRLLTNFFNLVTPIIPPANASAVLAELAGKVGSGGIWNMRGAIARLAGANDFPDLTSGLVAGDAGIPRLSELRTVHIDFGSVFDTAPGDLKTLAPMMYDEDETFSDANRDGRRSLANGVLRYVSSEDFSTSEVYVDRNCNGRFDMRGDFVTQHEFEPFIDANGSGNFDNGEASPLGGATRPDKLGVIGAFVDINADAFPDRITVDGTARARAVNENPMCGSHAPVTWPAAEDDPDYGVFDLSPPIGADDDAPYGRPVTSADHVSQQDLYEDGRNLGPVLGHYWPPSTFSFGNWPQDARRDPSNGERDPIYYFYLDPTFGGIVSRDNGGRPDPGGTSNAWINAFFSQWSAIFVALGI